MSDIIFLPEYAYSIKEIDFTDPSTFIEQRFGMKFPKLKLLSMIRWEVNLFG